MKKYTVLYADPPWRYRNKPNGRSPESHYPTMKTEDICALPVQALAAEDCALFLWVTMPMIFEAQKVLAAWGFRYKTVAFVWVKQNRKGTGIFWGMGYWTRANAELCLLATKGRPQRRAKNIHQVIISPVEEHSKKPEEARRRGGRRNRLHSASAESESYISVSSFFLSKLRPLRWVAILT